jgi:hypothetical protein
MYRKLDAVAECVRVEPERLASRTRDQLTAARCPAGDVSAKLTKAGTLWRCFARAAIAGADSGVLADLPHGDRLIAARRGET